MRATITKWLILIALFCYVITVNIWAGKEASRTKCSGITVTIAGANTADSITQKGVKALLSTYDKKIVGESIENLNTQEIENWLSGFNNFENVECVINSQGKLHLFVEPMKPELRVFTGGESYYINKDGKKIDSKAEFFTDVPVVSGNFNEKFTPKDLLKVTRFVEQDPFLSELVTSIHANDRNNILLIPRISGHVINIGNGRDLEQKKKAILAIYHQVMPYKGWEYYDTISVKFKGLVVATRRNKATAVHSLPLDNDIDVEEEALKAHAEVMEEEMAHQNNNTTNTTHN